MFSRIKLAALGLLLLLTVVIVLQNTETVETKLLFFTLSMPRAALLFGALTIGFSVGVLVANRLASRTADGEPSKSGQTT